MYLDILQQAGFSEKSAKVYVAALSLGTATIKQIALKAEIKRPTVYIHVEELMKEGLMEKLPSGKKEYFRAADPKVLEERAQERVTALRVAMPALESMRASIGGRPQVTVLEGKRALEGVYRDIAKAKEISFWADLGSVENYFVDSYIMLAESINKNKIPTREILPNSPEAQKSSRRYAATAGPTYSSRITSKGGILNDSVIFDDTVALFRLHQQNFFVVVIKEPSIATTIRSLFDMAWESAETFIGK